MGKVTITTRDGEEVEFPTKKEMIKTVAHRILADEEHPMTARQLYYRFVAADLLENKESQYQYLLESVKEARLEGRLPWGWIEDRTRSSAAGDADRVTPGDRFEHALNYLEETPERHELPRWHGQPAYVEVWVEKEALAAVFERACSELGVVSFPCRGYPSITSLKDAADRILAAEAAGRSPVIIYFGDYDPSGQDIERHINETLPGEFGASPEVGRAALTREQIDERELPPQPAKSTDARYDTFVEEHGEIAVELDALPPDDLRDMIHREVDEHFDESVREEALAVEEEESESIRGRVADELGR